MKTLYKAGKITHVRIEGLLNTLVSFKLKGRKVQVTSKRLRFYGGGIWDRIYTLWVDGKRARTTMNISELFPHFIAEANKKRT